ncbi:SusC/RagA family TonB-linked outer membrane protein [Flavobacterium gilvum]|uniref:SusC/RagA family TonB-linked outer membrane protein n=1 Tax=Flavobacterium gilvum TaxID=1492737 RepID=A0AAC9I5A2_9FLAO|nr:TonB-dependent receptor [Flavobacterium gilvum]AOW10711.1 SusC/RagA family TonB-linked outer membrane protein [Flavobacterium gilvum]
MRNFIVGFLALILLPAYMSGQVITGKVLDQTGLGIPGAFVVAGNVSAETDIDGNFSIAAKEGQILKISLVGFEAVSIPATAKPMTITMKESQDTALKEVVVIGYGTAKKKDLTGSSVKVSGKDVADKPNTNPVASIQGKVSGLSVVDSGKPGEKLDVRIRGTASRYQTQPLYVVDGLWTDNIDFINPNDIESMDILKDASSLAIFGARGANGVIIVTTKKAKEGKTTINFSTSLGIKHITNEPSLTDASNFKKLYDEQRINQGLPPYGYYNLYNANTDWIHAIENKGATIITHNISVTNGTEHNKLYVGAGYTEDEGLIKNEDYKRFTFNVNDELEISDAIKVGVNLGGSNSKLPQLHDFIRTLQATPIVEPYNQKQGMYNQLPSEIGGAQVGNPLLDVDGVANGTSLAEEFRFVGSVFTEIKFLEDFKFRASFSADLGNKDERKYSPVYNVWDNESNQATLYRSLALTDVWQYKTDDKKMQEDYLLTYTKSLGNHNITLLGGYNRNYQYYSQLSGNVKQYPNGTPIPHDPRFWYVNTFPYGDPTTKFAYSDQWDRASASYFTRLLYNYDGRYIVNASFRRDGSSDLREWQNFWTVGAAWDISKEKFMEEQKFFNNLKLKGSYGTLGNQYTSIHYPTYPNYKNGQSAVFGESLVPAYVLAYRNNPDLRWETVTSYEGGIEATMLDSRLKIEAAYYNKTTDDLLTFVDLGSEQFYTNSGKIENKGVEFSASWNDEINENWSYSLSGNFSTIDNVVKSVYIDGFQVFDGPSIMTAGAPMGSFYGYTVEGLYQSYADVLASPPSTLGAYGPGDFKYKDRNGDGKITPDDRSVIGNPTPDVSYGFSASLNYKNFSFSIDFAGVYGNEVYRNWGNGSTFAQFNYRTDRLDHWTAAGTSNWEPRINDGSSYNQLASTYMIEDGSYLRLRNVQFGYTFDTELLNKASIQSLRLYLNAQNPYTWTKASGFTPDIGGTPTQFGVDNGGYPVARVISLGLNVTF